MNLKVTDDSVIIDGYEIEGFIDKELCCNKCSTSLVYYEDFDAYFCPKCNLWTEAACDDPDCIYCPNRPEKPLP
ncbi:hypothetical protein RCG23_00990 [Neobacillus sp. PS3-34]|uniref:hypothetical protein n=1 Tax=Neobacillus sp. PS3-34 TaxID=3070678 RepID=UPI0027DF3B91|nr:hypothetical protein [Neobacillus sp. PS3-34]WML48750.1 hypothetical protein RCG23_00990 [Neobacillus sp. PS3-34]